MPRAWFVDSLTVIPDAAKRLAAMAKPEFDPRSVAIVESQIKGIAKPDSASVKQVDNELHKLKYDVATDKDAFLVLSEVYYPAGWKATLDGKDTAIYPTNHILRGIRVPAGKHVLELTFRPASYARSLMLSLCGLLLTVLAVLAGAFLAYRKKGVTAVQ